MAKGRTSTKGSSKKKKSKETEEVSSKKVSEETEQQPEEERAEGKGEGDSGEEEEVWDIVRVIPDNERDQFACSTEGCKEKPVAEWATNLEPEKPWYGCESCQAEEFGGWPEGALPSDSEEDENKSVPAEDSSDNDNDKAAKDDKPAPVGDEENASADKAESKTESPSSSPSDGDGNDNAESCSAKPCEDIDHATTLLGSTKIEATPAKATGVEVESAEAGESNGSTDDANTNEPIDGEATPADADADADAIDEEELEGDDAYNLFKVLPAESIASNAPALCQICEDNALPAFGIYRGEKLKDGWYYCLDCQDADFDGWPDKASEFPSGLVPSVEHENIMREFCCAPGSEPSRINPELRPKLDAASHSHSPMPAGSSGKKDRQLTPVPSTQTQGGKSSKKKPAAITPSPATTVPYNIPCTKDKDKKKGVDSVNAKKTYAKWQAEADKVAGPNGKAKIVINRKEIKEYVFNYLHDSFRCKNVNSIYEELKKVVPAPLLKSCLDDMAELNKEPVFMSDDEEDDEPPKPSAVKSKPDDPYSGSLRFKGGRNAMSSLYYVDYSKGANGGNFDAEAYNEVFGKQSALASEESVLKMECTALTSQAVKLESEPTNEEAASCLAAISAAVEKLQMEEEEARKNCGNEDYKKKLKKRISEMASVCRKRKRLALDFLTTMEDITEGTITRKKCLRGEGQIEMESDDMAVALAKEAHAAKKQRLASGKVQYKKQGATGMAAGKVSLADPNFVGITIDSQGNVQREYVTED